MSHPGAPDRGDIIAMLAVLGDRAPEAVPERIGSLELTWLITGVEQKYDVTLDLSEDDLSRMTTVSGAVAALRDALAGAGHG
jgi:3-deoxy-D-manno-octulosonate 8-phosphate phosphatase KdsC-like HAD superfamily phosphatase